ncbi:class I SAM-dependent methyltransferase [Roseofilum capinflatum]|uniref:Class I SAM-dependent methyltransferase n=1 Tax=Roseofilum capinflatum BLCC-M114 TaxID=3022440 RepID=A0ABT7BCW6_9CYAN|nr:class I SAM-dependent methyltransferase [Roseofilum capinflatum]MDJ1177030.1 class I SAM-dependent methyltransferase [Roseofilum capinflatum BLCC-M114]
MKNWDMIIDELDLSVFETIPSQTSAEDRRSLLAVQRATARKYKEYTYLEIGSYLGGTIQPHLVDNRCKRIYSIDPRPVEQPDDRSPGYIVHYENNSTEKMLNMLKAIGYGDIGKIECFDVDASQVDSERIKTAPEIMFIDGEHTQSSTRSDFEFCRKVVSENGVILFHDYTIIYPAVIEICNLLDRQPITYVPLKFKGSVFGIFFDSELVYADPYLHEIWQQAENFESKVGYRQWEPVAIDKILD